MKYPKHPNTKFNAFVALTSNGQRHHVNWNNLILKPIQLIKCGFVCVIFKSNTSFGARFHNNDLWKWKCIPSLFFNVSVSLEIEMNFKTINRKKTDSRKVVYELWIKWNGAHIEYTEHRIPKPSKHKHFVDCECYPTAKLSTFSNIIFKSMLR